MSHTPGPWKVNSEFGTKTPYICQASDDGIIATMARSPFLSGFGEFSPEQVADNARLIAAAPELLEALKALLQEHIDAARIAMATPAEIAARNAIAKAEGK